jgi:hypothetical protein
MEEAAKAAEALGMKREKETSVLEASESTSKKGSAK